jgi:hypothetical protein
VRQHTGSTCDYEYSRFIAALASFGRCAVQSP